jgi:hypothetical protein
MKEILEEYVKDLPEDVKSVLLKTLQIERELQDVVMDKAAKDRIKDLIEATATRSKTQP